MTHWKDLVKEDREAVLQRDPAAKSMAEVKLCYPGLKALQIHRRANVLFKKGHILLADRVNELIALAYKEDLFTGWMETAQKTEGIEVSYDDTGRPIN